MTEPPGLYQPFFTAAERRDLSAGEVKPLEEEIKLVRVAMRRILKISKSQEGEDQVKTLVLLSAVSSRVASLLRTQEQLTRGKPSGSESDLRNMLENVLLEVQADWPKL